MRSALDSASANGEIALAPDVPEGHSLSYPLAIALAAAIAMAVASGLWRAWTPLVGGPDPVDAITIGPFWRQNLISATLAAILASVACGLAARTVGHRIGHVTVPRLWRVHARPISLMGSLAIFAGIAAGVLVGAGSALGSAKIVGAAVGVIGMGTVGFIDDLRGLTPRTRLFVTAAVAEVAWMMGLRADVFGEGAAGTVANALLTMLWFVVVTHAFNVFDNMDGASAGVAVASSLSIAAMAAVANQGVLVVLALSLAGGAVGYLVHNFFPARLYMGDSGALALGFGVAALGLMLEPPVKRPLGFALPLLAVAVPLFDTALVSISRVRGRQRVAIGGTDHMTHRLHTAGFGVRTVAPFLFVAQATLGGMGVVIASIPRAAGWATLALVGSGGIMTLLIFLRLPEWRPIERPSEAPITLVDG
jgi:UDP-GlcNAc:undecaprenyl-phosphate GlcNAc-1-phosphate transferase